MRKWYKQLDTICRQIYCCFDGPDGLVIQTDIATYESYYQRLGWELLGRATPLPCFDHMAHQKTTQLVIEQPVYEEPVIRQQRLF